MKIAIATEGTNVAAHFGRCPEYTVVMVDDGQCTDRTILPNPGHEPGRIPRFLHEHGVDLVIAGGMGPRAQNLFEELGMQHLAGVSGTVDTAIERCLAGTLAGGESLCNHGSGDQHGHDCGHPQ